MPFFNVHKSVFATCLFYCLTQEMAQLSNKFVFGAKCLQISNLKIALRLNISLYHSLKESHEEPLSSEWHEKSFLKLTKLSRLLKNVDSVDGRLVDLRDSSIIFDERVEQKMLSFKSLARFFIGSHLTQQTTLKTNCLSPFLCFGKPSERETMIVSSLTQVSNFLNITAQQRKVIRFTICPQVTQHRIWTGTLEEVLSGLKPELDYLNSQFPSKGTLMAQQIVFNCLKFLQDADVSCTNLDSTSWMRLAPVKSAAAAQSSKWEDVLEMFNDLIECVKTESRLVHHAVKLESMKEGLAQIKDVLIDKSIGYKETRHQESLVQKKLSKTLGYSSQCLFTLLLYYLYGHVRDIEVDLCGGVYNNGDQENSFRLCMGKIVTSDEEKAIKSGVRHLDRALGLFKFVWDTAGMKGALDLQGHLWCVGGGEAEGRMLTYKGKKFFINGICV